MTENVLPFAAEPYPSWTAGILALCEAMDDPQRVPAAVRRLERTAERMTLTTEDLCVLALVSPVLAPDEPRDAETEATDPVSAEDTPRTQPNGMRAQALAILESIEAPIRAREERAEAAFGPDDPRRLLADTIWGVVAAALMDVSDRLESRDPYRRLAVRLGLWFHPSSPLRWMGIPLGEVGGIRDLLRRLVACLPPQDEGASVTARLLRIVAGVQTVAHTADGLSVLLDIIRALGEETDSPAARVLAESLLLATMEAFGWDKRDAEPTCDRVMAVELSNRSNAADDVWGCTSSLPNWLRQDKRSMLSPDLPWFLPDLCFHLQEWPKGTEPELISTLVGLVGREGLDAFPHGPFPLNFYGGWPPERALPARLAKTLPEAHDLLRLLSLRDGDWAEAGGEFGPGFWGDPPGFWGGLPDSDDDTMDLRGACERAIGRGDPALADMLVGCWLLYMFLEQNPLIPARSLWW